MILKQDYTYAIDGESHLINVTEAVKGNNYYCPSCGEIMIPRQGSIRRWHFAHKGNLRNCSYETYLHKVAKKRICECFNESPQFTILVHSKRTCAVAGCLIGEIYFCTWNGTNKFNLKEYYTHCEEEVKIDNYRADLVISNKTNNSFPILIEIYVTHKSTQEKLNSNYRIIEIKIESEEDIDQIVSTASIEGSSSAFNYGLEMKDEKNRFYNFKINSKEVPGIENQMFKYRFWVNQKGYFHLDTHPVRCLEQNPSDFENSIFRIESRLPISWDFAFFMLSMSGIGIKYCTMCEFYKMNNRYERSICVLYKSKGTKQNPRLSSAMRCPYFKQIDYSGIDYEKNVAFIKECKIKINK